MNKNQRKEMKQQSKRSLQDVVGKETYTVWMNMLRELVPDGRTHRLSVVIAGMLQYTFEVAERIDDGNEDEHSVAMSVIDAAESGNPDDIKGLIHDVVAQLFDDAGVAYERISKRGEPYSIADEAYNEFASWFDYLWD
ncbi:MAG: hypothetical protein ACXW4M_14940 [Anaerolineales bacterium]